MFLALAGSGAVRAAEPLPPVDDLVRYFDTIVFGSELDPKYASTVIAKWSGVIGITIQHRVTKRYATFLQTHLLNLQKLTGLRFKSVKPGDKIQSIDFIFLKRNEMSKIQVPSADRSAMKNAAAHGGCYFLSWKKPPSRILKTVIVINVERDEALTNSCLLEELTQSLGLPNDSDMLRPSIFSDRDHLYELSPADEILVRTLYDPRMKAGLPRAKALQAARPIIEELKRARSATTSRGRGG